ncbi:MAG TPA: CoA pyrophosphatase [Rhizomicrobium sp.]|jgi:8-oxo-dGTP pyrophosphatase MutT (NUDIX family)
MNAPLRSPFAHIARQMVEEGFATLRSRLIAAAPDLPLVPRRGDYDLNPDIQRPGASSLRPAAVLVPLIRRSPPTVLFTKRTEHLARHAGQVSFPGGRVQCDDASLADTALRETQEETGIDTAFVTVIGYLDPYETGTGFAILPVIGVVREGFELAPSPQEVAEIFEVPLSFLFDPANCSRRSGEWQGHRREFYAFNFDGHYIWGATAAIVVHLRDRLVT